jgi:hypothetical protein
MIEHLRERRERLADRLPLAAGLMEFGHQAVDVGDLQPSDRGSSVSGAMRGPDWYYTAPGQSQPNREQFAGVEWRPNELAALLRREGYVDEEVEDDE